MPPGVPSRSAPRVIVRIGLHAEGTHDASDDGFNALREHSRITWIEQETRLAATPED